MKVIEQNPLIENFVHSDFPTRTVPSTNTLVEIISNEILASKQLRYGPRTQLYLPTLHSVVRYWVEQNQPIPFVVPWGSEKPNGTGPDIAELCALKTMKCLETRVRRHYYPGITIRIRLEDASAPHLFYERREAAREEADLYSSTLTRLVSIMQLDFVKAIRESSLISEQDFDLEADRILPIMQDYLNAAAGELTAFYALGKLGWQNPIPQVTRDFYLHQFEKLYPDKSTSEHLHLLARYFAGVLTRVRLNIQVNDSEWGSHFLELAFLGPTPGVDFRFPRRIHYRTIPRELTTKHMPPWRAKGYFVISDCGICPKLASFSEERDYTAHSLILERGDEQAQITSDYVTE